MIHWIFGSPMPLIFHKAFTWCMFCSEFVIYGVVVCESVKLIFCNQHKTFVCCYCPLNFMTMVSYERHGVSDQRQQDCLFNSLHKLTAKKISKIFHVMMPSWYYKQHTTIGLVQKGRNSIANALELPLSCTPIDIMAKIGRVITQPQCILEELTCLPVASWPVFSTIIVWRYQKNGQSVRHLMLLHIKSKFTERCFRQPVPSMVRISGVSG